MKVFNVKQWIESRYYRRCLRKAQRGLHRVANELYVARITMPERAEEINQILDEVMYPCIQHLEKMRVEEL